MSAPLASLLSGGQIAKRVFDQPTGSVRVIPSPLTAFEIESTNTAQKASVTNTSTGVIVPAFSSVGLKTIALYTHTTSTITGPQVCTLEVSPSDTDEVWIATATTITESATNNAVVMSAIGSICARRARVSIAAAITTGTFDIYVVGEGT